MKRITVVIPDELNRLLQAERRRRDVSAAAVVRDALESYFGMGKAANRLSIIGIGASGYRDTARNFEEILDQELAKDRDR